jgi:hypothetical protein
MTARLIAAATRGLLLFATALNGQAATFTFEADTVGLTTPFTDTVAGLSATFGGSASVCAGIGLFVSLTGNVLIQAFCGPLNQTGQLSIDFSSSLSHIDLNFATAGGLNTLTLSAFQGGTAVGSSNFPSAIPAGHVNGEGTASFNGTFNRVVLSTTGLLALDNVNATAVPEPATTGTLIMGLATSIFLVRRRSNCAVARFLD